MRQSCTQHLPRVSTRHPKLHVSKSELLSDLHPKPAPTPTAFPLPLHSSRVKPLKSKSNQVAPLLRTLNRPPATVSESPQGPSLCLLSSWPCGNHMAWNQQRVLQPRGPHTSSAWNVPPPVTANFLPLSCVTISIRLTPPTPVQPPQPPAPIPTSLWHSSFLFLPCLFLFP